MWPVPLTTNYKLDSLGKKYNVFFSSLYLGVCRLCGAFVWHDVVITVYNFILGMYNSERAKRGCSECPLGMFQPNEGGIQCLLCPVGHYNGAPGSSQCHQCAPGTYQNQAGQVRLHEHTILF